MEFKNDLGKPWKFQDGDFTVYRSSVWSPRGAIPSGAASRSMWTRTAAWTTLRATRTTLSPTADSARDASRSKTTCTTRAA